MVTVSVRIREGTVSRQARITAESIRQALEVAGEERPGVSVEVVFPIDPEAYFAADARRKANLSSVRGGTAVRALDAVEFLGAPPG